MRDSEIILTFSGGEVSCVVDDRIRPLLAEGEFTTRRASYVEPVRPILRWLFHLIRRRVDDHLQVADWTRRWRCDWQARILNGGPTLGPFAHRLDAIGAEIDWLNEQ